MNNIFEISFFLIMLFIVGIFWCRRNNDLIQNILLSVWICLVYWLNAPNFLNIIEGTELKKNILNIPLNFYQSLGTVYIFISNVLLAILGVMVSKQWSKNKHYNSKEVKQKFDMFAEDAAELRVIGHDLDFLLDDKYTMQRAKIEKLRDKAMLLCAFPNEERLIKLYNDLMNKEIKVRAYSGKEGVANLKGQIKIDGKKRESGIFVLKSSSDERVKIPFIDRQYNRFFELTELSAGYLVDSISKQFDRTFSESKNPVIRCIALDLGGVYLDGDIDDFYMYIKQEFDIKIPTYKGDRLNINDKMMLGDITIKEYLMEVSDDMKNLDDCKWEKIQERWQQTWSPNKNMKRLMEDVAKYGYEIIPFSNLDRENGDKYIRDNYLPLCCKERYLSYERKMSKPHEQTFKDFSKFVKSKDVIYGEYQILLIDDQKENISIATELGWKTIYYSNKTSIEKLIEQFQIIGILPEEYNLKTKG